MITAKTVRLDMMKRYLEPINTVQYEVDSRILDIYMTAANAPVNVEAASVVFYAVKPDGTILFNACDIIDAAAGHVQYTVTQQTCAAAGELRCWLLIVKDDSELRSMEFAVTVHPSDDDSEAIESTSEFSALQAALSIVSGYDARITAVEEAVEEFEGGGSGPVAMTDLTDVDGTDTPAKNDIPKFNGTKFVFVPEGTDFEFSIATFSTNAGSSPVLIGTGVWKAAGAITFTGAYNNGPPSSAYVALSGWSNLAMGGTGLVTAVSAEAVNYPSVGGTRVFTLNATDGTDSDSKSVTFAFYNKRFWGVSTKAGSFIESDVEVLASSEISNSKGKTFSVTPGTDLYIVYAYPKRLGTVVFVVGGFEGGFEAPETVSVTNSAGFTEDYYVYRSTNANLGATTVVAS